MVAAHVGGRTDVKCRERYSNVLDPAVRMKPWSKVDDERLIQLLRINGTHWASIAREHGKEGVTDRSVRRRWLSLAKRRPEIKKELKQCSGYQNIKVNMVNSAFPPSSLVIPHAPPAPTTCHTLEALGRIPGNWQQRADQKLMASVRAHNGGVSPGQVARHVFNLENNAIPLQGAGAVFSTQLPNHFNANVPIPPPPKPLVLPQQHTLSNALNPTFDVAGVFAKRRHPPTNTALKIPSPKRPRVKVKSEPGRVKMHKRNYIEIGAPSAQSPPIPIPNQVDQLVPNQVNQLTILPPPITGGPIDDNRNLPPMVSPPGMIAPPLVTSN